MRVTKRQIRRLIREEILREVSGPEERGEPGHKDPETGNWVDPGQPGYDYTKDKTLEQGSPSENRFKAGREGWISGLEAYGSTGTGLPFYVAVEDSHSLLAQVMGNLANAAKEQTPDGNPMLGPVSSQLFKELEHAIETFVGSTGGDL